MLNADAKATALGTVGSLASGTTLSSLGISNGQTITVNDGTSTTTYTVGERRDRDRRQPRDCNRRRYGCGERLARRRQDPDRVGQLLDTLSIGGTAAAAVGYDSSNDSFAPMNLLQQGITQGQTLTINTTSSGTETVTFGTGAGRSLDARRPARETADLYRHRERGGRRQRKRQVRRGERERRHPCRQRAGDGVDAAKFGSSVPTHVPLTAPSSPTIRPRSSIPRIGAGAITAYDVSGTPVNLQMRWAKVDSTSLGTGHSNTWNLFYQVNSNATGPNPRGRTSA